MCKFLHCVEGPFSWRNIVRRVEEKKCVGCSLRAPANEMFLLDKSVSDGDLNIV